MRIVYKAILDANDKYNSECRHNHRSYRTARRCASNGLVKVYDFDSGSTAIWGPLDDVLPQWRPS